MKKLLNTCFLLLALSQTPVFGLTLVQEAELLLHAGKYDAALEKLKNIPSQPRESFYRALLLRAEIALAQGKPELAHTLFEQAEGSSGDAPEPELGQVRADLQAGEFRRASAFALLVSGEHPNSQEALAFGAFLEERAGQTKRALDFLDKARQKAPEAVPLLGAYTEILIDRGRAAEAINVLDTWIFAHRPQGDIYALRARAALATRDSESTRVWRARAARAYAAAGDTQRANQLTDWLKHTGSEPEAVFTAGTLASKGSWLPPYFEPFPPVTGRTGNGFVIEGGTRVVTLARLLAGKHNDLFVRNGTGHFRRARVESTDLASGLAILRLDTPYESRWSLTRDQFASPVPGRSALVVGFGITDSVEASWPSLSLGFTLRPGGSGALQVSADLPNTSAGSPIFDTTGRLTGIVLGVEATSSGVLSNTPILDASALGKVLGAAPVASPPAAPLALKELFERVQGAVVVVVVP
jgi:serine protease Do